MLQGSSICNACRSHRRQLRAAPTPAPRRCSVPQQPIKYAGARIVCNVTDTAAKPGMAAMPKGEFLRAPRLPSCLRTSCCTAVPQDLAGEDQERWQDGLQLLKELGMDDELAEKSLKRGFGWSSQAYWWKDKVNEVPKPGEVHNPWWPLA